MSVTHQLLSELVSAFEAQKKFNALRIELISIVVKEGPEAQTFRVGDYNITVVPFSMPGRVTILRAREVDAPAPVKDSPTVEHTAHAAAYAFAGESAKVPGNVSLDVKESDAIGLALDTLTSGFQWRKSPQGASFWQGITNALRCARGQPPLKY